MARPAIVVSLPLDESDQVFAELALAGFEVLTVDRAFEFEALLDSRRDIAVAVLDGDWKRQVPAFQSTLRDGGRSVPALIVTSARGLERQAPGDDGSNEYFARPYSADSIRWRVEAMCIRRETVDDGSGPVLQSKADDHEALSRRATLITVFNPKGGVGKTTIATNLASSLQARREQSVLLIDADTVTGHVSTSLRSTHRGRSRTAGGTRPTAVRRSRWKHLRRRMGPGCVWCPSPTPRSTRRSSTRSVFRPPSRPLGAHST
jgi:hypothetical protein